MKIQRSFAICSSSLLLSFFLLLNCAGAQAQSKNASKYACLEANPAALCNASITCGSASTPCTVDVKRTASSAESVASIAKPKGNATFCVNAGTTLTWQSTSKNTGFRRGLRPFRSVCAGWNHHRRFRSLGLRRGEEARLLQVFRRSLRVGRHLRDVRERKCRGYRRRWRQLTFCRA